MTACSTLKMLTWPRFNSKSYCCHNRSRFCASERKGVSAADIWDTIAWEDMLAGGKLAEDMVQVRDNMVQVLPWLMQLGPLYSSYRQ